jgi:fido (protein-threonine AMPylation protein)
LVSLKNKSFQDPYIEQGSSCLHNLLGIKDSEELSKAETAFVLNRCYELECASVNQPVVDKAFDFQHLKDIHKHLFQDVYEWAGQVREVNISKGDTKFLPHHLIERGAHSIFSELKQNNYLKGLASDDFSKNAGYYLGEINHIHPFREGNGRTQREFINQLANHNGYHIEWKNVSQRQMVEASIEADKGNVKPLAVLIHENLSDRDIVLVIKQNRSYDGGYVKLSSAEAGKKYDGTIIGVTERHVMQAPIDSPDHIIIHNRHSLSKTPDMDKRVKISYPRYPLGDVGLVREQETVKEMGSSKDHDLGKNPQQHEWER